MTGRALTSCPNSSARDGALVPALGGLWSFYFVRGSHRTSIEVAGQMIDAAEVLDDLEASLIGHVCLGYSKYFQGDLTAGRQSAERSWELHDKVKDRPPHIHLPQDPGLSALSFLGPVRWSVGDQVGGDARGRRIVGSWHRAGEQAGDKSLSHRSVPTHGCTRSAELPRRLSKRRNRSLAIATAHRIEWAVVNLSIHQGLAMAHLNTNGKGIQEGAAIVNANLGYWRAGGAETMVPYFLGELAEAFVVRESIRPRSIWSMRRSNWAIGSASTSMMPSCIGSGARPGWAATRLHGLVAWTTCGVPSHGRANSAPSRLRSGPLSAS